MKSVRYKSSIPPTAQERVIKRYPSGAKNESEYHLRRKLVGVRCFFESGEPELEYAINDGKPHGFKLVWHGPGVLLSVEPYARGLPHGVAKQWDDHGRLIGTYRMIRGTGVDLWRQPRDRGKPYLSEVLYLKNGRPHGFEWWLEEDQKRVFIERHWKDGELHGIEREWNGERHLSRGYPKYHVAGKQVTKRQYLKAGSLDSTLPPFRLQDNKPGRRFPSEIEKHLAR